MPRILSYLKSTEINRIEIVPHRKFWNSVIMMTQRERPKHNWQVAKQHMTDETVCRDDTYADRYRLKSSSSSAIIEETRVRNSRTSDSTFITNVQFLTVDSVRHARSRRRCRECILEWSVISGRIFVRSTSLKGGQIKAKPPREMTETKQQCDEDGERWNDAPMKRGAEKTRNEGGILIILR